MTTLQAKVATYSSVALRGLSYIFFRWVAGPVSRVLQIIVTFGLTDRYSLCFP
jgi:hypothetical protein